MSGKQLNEDQKKLNRLGSKTTKHLLDMSHDKAVSSNHIHRLNLLKDETIQNKVKIAVHGIKLKSFINNQDRLKVE